MRKLFLIVTLLYSFLSVVGQNGLNNGKYFLLLDETKKVSINSFIDNQIKKHKTYSISKKCIYTTDQEDRVAILDTVKNIVTLFNIETSEEFKLEIPFDIKPKAILLNNENLFIGGERGKEMLVQYHLKNKKWYQLQIPIEVMFPGKAIDDLVVNDSLLIAIDNIVMPKYVLFYRLNSNSKLEFSNFKKLKSNGAYESISQGRINKEYFGLISGTYSGYIGASEHITIYKDLKLTSSFALSSNQQDNNYQTFTDFVIIKDKVIIASKEKGLGVFEIKDTYFSETDEYKNIGFNSRVKTSKIKYEVS